MKHGIKLKFVVASALALSCVGSVSMVCVKPAMAQDPGADKKISLNFQNAPIQTVLKTLFTSVGVNYSIDPAIQSNVNITMNDVNFVVALRSLLHAANPPLTYDQANGVYNVRLKKTVVASSGGGVTTTPVSTSNGDPSDDNNPTPQAQPVGTTDPSQFRPYHIGIDHFDAAYITQFLSGQKGIFVVNVSAPSGSGGTGGTGGTTGTTGGANSGIGGIGGGMNISAGGYPH